MHGLPAGYPLCGSPLNWPLYISTFLFELWVELFVLRVFPCSSAGESHVAPSSAEGPRASTPSVVLVVATAPAVVLGLVEPPPPPPPPPHWAYPSWVLWLPSSPSLARHVLCSSWQTSGPKSAGAQLAKELVLLCQWLEGLVKVAKITTVSEYLARWKYTLRKEKQKLAHERLETLSESKVL